MDRGGLNEGVPLEYVHRRCGKTTRPVLACSECGEPLRPEEVTPQLGPALKQLAHDITEAGEELPDIPPLLRRSM